jgi:membrane protease subunit HflK
MPWTNQGGGGGPWGGGGKGPWGSGPQPSGGPTPPDLEEMLRRGQDRLRRFLPGGNLGGGGFALLAIAALALWGASGFFRVEPDELGVVLRFGKEVREVQPGLNYHLPYPIETALTPKALRVNKIDIGRQTVESNRGGLATREVPEESLMLTGDENIVDVDFSVFWRVKPTGVGDYLFNIQNPQGTVKAVAESAMREVIGRSDIQPILTGARQTIEVAVQDLMQKTLDHYGAGIVVQQVQLQKVDPPQQVIDAFRDVQAARIDLDRSVNEAQTYANRVIPRARGNVAKIIQAAEAYKQQTVAEATGQTSRFTQIYDQYKKAPDVTRERMYLETMERVLGGASKIIIDSKDGAQGVVPYLPLSALAPPAPRPPAPASSAGSASQPQTSGGGQ